MSKTYQPLDEKNKAIIEKLLEEKVPMRQISEIVNVSVHNIFLCKNKIEKVSRGKVINISSVSVKLYSDLHNISDNLGIKFGDFMRKELRKISESYPQKMKLKKADC